MSRIYAFLLAKFAIVPGLGSGGGVNPILAMPGFWVHMDPQPIPRGDLPRHKKVHKKTLRLAHRGIVNKQYLKYRVIISESKECVCQKHDD